MNRYKMVRLLTHLKNEGVSRDQITKATTAFMMEGVEEQVEQIVHFAFEGYKKPSRRGANSDEDRPRRH